MDDSTASRMDLCRALGLPNMMSLHQLVVEGAKGNIQAILQRGIQAKTLLQLGYDQGGMKRIGYKNNLLRMLGYPVPPEAEEPPPVQRPAPPATSPGEKSLKQLIAAGYDYEKLKALGYTLHHFKLEGFEVRDLERLGLRIDDLTREFDVHQMKVAGYRARQLAPYYAGSQIRSAFTAYDLKSQGFSAQELLNLGYPIHQIKTAGFGHGELMKIGVK